MLDIKIKKSLPEFRLDVSFSVEHEILAIVGPSGCGKTMTLKCIAGLFPPDEGLIALNKKVLFDSRTGINLASRQREVGFVFQNYALFPHMNVFDNVAFGIHQLNQFGNKVIRERVSNLMHKMHLGKYEKRYPGQLSGGQQQRVAIARALVTEPQVLLLDEPFSALDSIVKESLQDELLDLQKYFAGHVILVTHNLAEAYKLSSRIAVYDAGRILQWDDKRAIIDQPANAGVARLTGVKNLFNGVIEEAGSTYTLINIAELRGLFRAESKSSVKFIKGQQVGVGIRSDHIKLTEESGKNTVPVQVKKIVDEISGNTYHFSAVAANGLETKLEAKIPHRQMEKINIGASCYLHLPPNNLFIMSR